MAIVGIRPCLKWDHQATSLIAQAKSGLTPISDIAGRTWDVSFGPIVDIGQSSLRSAHCKLPTKSAGETLPDTRTGSQVPLLWLMARSTIIRQHKDNWQRQLKDGRIGAREA